MKGRLGFCVVLALLGVGCERESGQTGSAATAPSCVCGSLDEGAAISGTVVSVDASTVTVRVVSTYGSAGAPERFHVGDVVGGVPGAPYSCPQNPFEPAVGDRVFALYTAPAIPACPDAGATCAARETALRNGRLFVLPLTDPVVFTDGSRVPLKDIPSLGSDPNCWSRYP